MSRNATAWMVCAALSAAIVIFTVVIPFRRAPVAELQTIAFEPRAKSVVLFTGDEVFIDMDEVERCAELPPKTSCRVMSKVILAVRDGTWKPIVLNP